MAKTAKLEKKVESITKRLEAARKKELKAKKKVQKLLADPNGKRTGSGEIPTGYDAWTKDERQAHQAATERLGKALSKVSRLDAEVERLEKKRKKAKKALRKARLAEGRKTDTEATEAGPDESPGET